MSIRNWLSGCPAGQAARSKAQLKSAAAAEVQVKLLSRSEQSSLDKVKSQVIDELNVKDIEVIDDISVLQNSGYVIESDGGYSIAVNPEIAPELLKEGLAREIVHRLQTMRREADFEIADHIITCYEGGEYVEQVMNDYTDYIKHETLSDEIKNTVPPESVHTGSYRINGTNKTAVASFNNAG